MQDASAITGIVPAAGLGTRMPHLPHAKELLCVSGRPVIDFSLDQLRLAGVDRCAAVVSSRKPELIRHLESTDGLAVRFVYQDVPAGLAAAVALGLPDDGTACLLLPDTVIRPGDALRRVRGAYEASGADLMLGVFPTARAHELGPVRLSADGEVIEVQDKPAQTDLANSWGMAMWGPRFSDLLRAAVARDPGANLGLLFHAATTTLAVRGIWFADGAFHDTGTPDGLRAAEDFLSR
jgi:glucose-1-phosphate thymidylyltransferase